MYIVLSVILYIILSIFFLSFKHYSSIYCSFVLSFFCLSYSSFCLLFCLLIYRSVAVYFLFYHSVCFISMVQLIYHTILKSIYLLCLSYYLLFALFIVLSFGLSFCIVHVLLFCLLYCSILQSIYHFVHYFISGSLYTLFCLWFCCSIFLFIVSFDLQYYSITLSIILSLCPSSKLIQTQWFMLV